jgi:hypothetical protein
MINQLKIVLIFNFLVDYLKQSIIIICTTNKDKILNKKQMDSIKETIFFIIFTLAAFVILGVIAIEQMNYCESISLTEEAIKNCINL